MDAVQVTPADPLEDGVPGQPEGRQLSNPDVPVLPDRDCRNLRVDVGGLARLFAHD
jgi:hypothetical protein